MPIPNKEASIRIAKSVLWTEATRQQNMLRPPMPPRGGGGSGGIKIAVAFAEIPAAVVTDSTITAGLGTQAADMMFSDDGGQTWAKDSDVGTIDVLNFSMTAIFASATVPVALMMAAFGEYWMVANVMDFRAIPGFDETTMQIPYHSENTTDYKQDATDCQQAVSGAPTNP